jgi:hypothetical protein
MPSKKRKPAGPEFLGKPRNEPPLFKKDDKKKGRKGK